MYICESWWDHFSDVTLVNDDWWYLLNILLIWQADTEDNEDHEDHDDHDYYDDYDDQWWSKWMKMDDGR